MKWIGSLGKVVGVGEGRGKIRDGGVVGSRWRCLEEIFVR